VSVEVIPDSYDLDVDLDGSLGLSGIPTSYALDVRDLPKIELTADVTVRPLTIEPLDVSVRLKEFPSIRAHVPANFSVALSLLGLPLVRLQLCGEAQVITEPYVPNPCERCGAEPDRGKAE